MSFPRRGEIWLARIPGWPPEAQERPVLILSIDVRNRLASDVIVVPLTTRLRPMATHVEIPEGEGGLRHTSMAKCEQVTTLPKAYLVRGPFAGSISPQKIREVERAIQIAVGIIPQRSRGA